MDRSKLKSELTRDEGRRLEAYKDSVGLWTIGIGHLLGGAPRMSRITDAECDALFEGDVAAAIEVLTKYVDLPVQMRIDEVRMRALVNMAFNLGHRLGEFKRFLAAVNGEDWLRAGTEMEQSAWFHQVGARAVRLRHMIETGEDA